MSEQNTLRDVLTANLEAAEAGTLGQSADTIEPPAVEAPQQSATDGRARDEQGRFAPKRETAPEPAPQPEAAPATVEPPALQRPTTWKKDYLPIWDKLATGAALTPEEARKLAEYSNQREKEYATGVSTYRAEAQNAKALQEAMEPFMPSLQQYNIKPNEWIRNLGTAHQTLALGSPEQKLQMFAKLAQDYGVPLNAIAPMQQGQLDPIIPQLMAEIQNLKQGVNTVTSWREQQEQQAIQQQIAKFQDAEKYPHFEQVRGTMAQLLESGLAQDLDTAYSKALRMNDEVWQAEQERQAQAQATQTQAAKAQAVAQAKAKAVSPRSATPSGAVVTNTAKDRRALLAEQLDSAVGGRV